MRARNPNSSMPENEAVPHTASHIHSHTDTHPSSWHTQHTQLTHLCESVAGHCARRRGPEHHQVPVTVGHDQGRGPGPEHRHPAAGPQLLHHTAHTGLGLLRRPETRGNMQRTMATRSAPEPTGRWEEAISPYGLCRGFNSLHSHVVTPQQNIEPAIDACVWIRGYSAQ